MHEIALSTQLARSVTRAAQGARVLTIRLEIGALRQVVPETLEYAWSFVTKGTRLDASQLLINWIPLRISCPSGHVSVVEGELNMRCPTCGVVSHVVSGREFRIIDIDVISSERS